MKKKKAKKIDLSEKKLFPPRTTKVSKKTYDRIFCKVYDKYEGKYGDLVERYVDLWIILNKETFSKEKIYHSLDEIEQEFFPFLYKKKKEGEIMKDPKKYAEKIAKEIIAKAKARLK